MDIAQVTRRSGLPPSTLRYYEERGLIAPIGRQGLRRQYDPKVLDRLALISLARAAGFSLEEIARNAGVGVGKPLGQRRPRLPLGIIVHPTEIRVIAEDPPGTASNAVKVGGAGGGSSVRPLAEADWPPRGEF